MILVLNEWLFHDLMGDNGTTALQETVTFLNAFRQSDDQLVIPPHSAWNDKAFQLMKRLDPVGRGISRLFHRQILNSDKAIRVMADAMKPLPGDLSTLVPAEDSYLVQVYLAAKADLLVTTDHGLFDALAGPSNVVCRMRDDFLTGYPS